MPDWTTPRTWATNDVVTAAMLNTDVRDNLSYLAGPPSCRVYRSTAQTISNGSFTAISFDQERWDTDGMHDPASNPTRVSLTETGVWHMAGHVEWAANSTGLRHVSIFIAGAFFIAKQETGAIGASGLTRMSVDTIYKVIGPLGYIQLYVYQDSGGALNVNGGVANHSAELSVTKLGYGGG